TDSSIEAVPHEKAENTQRWQKPAECIPAVEVPQTPDDQQADRSPYVPPIHAIGEGGCQDQLHKDLCQNRPAHRGLTCEKGNQCDGTKSYDAGSRTPADTDIPLRRIDREPKRSLVHLTSLLPNAQAHLSALQLTLRDNIRMDDTLASHEQGCRSAPSGAAHVR